MMNVIETIPVISASSPSSLCCGHEGFQSSSRGVSRGEISSSPARQSAMSGSVLNLHTLLGKGCSIVPAWALPKWRPVVTKPAKAFRGQ